MKKDFEILKKILIDLHYTESYVEVLLNHLTTELEKSSLSEITPQFIYIHLILSSPKFL
jgi:hypothetical protein